MYISIVHADMCVFTLKYREQTPPFKTSQLP